MTGRSPEPPAAEKEEHGDGSDVEAVERGEQDAGSMENEVDRAQRREEEAAEG